MLLAIILFTVYSHNNIIYADSIQEKHVLIVNPFTQDYPGSQLYIKGIKSTLEKNSEFKFDYSYEYLDLARHSHDERYLEDLAKYLKAKYLKYKPDYIITAISAYSLFSKYGNDVFPNIPVIIDRDDDTHFINPMPPNHIEISQLTEIDKNIDIILKTKPLTKKIYMVLGDSINERNIAKPILEAENKFSDKVEFVLLNKLPYEDMLKVIKNAEDNSVILYFRWYSDVKGKSFIPTEVIQTVCQYAKVPVYGVSMQYLGSGVIGGYVGNQELVGQTAGSIVLNILKGNKLSDNHIYASSRVYIFDWRQLKRWKIDEKILPTGSIIQYREKNVWELYKAYIIGTFVLLIVQAVLIIVLLINKRKRKRAETELLQANNSLREMTEKLINIDKMKDEFLVTTSHELQTPLNGIINISETLVEGKYGDINQKQEEELNVILAVSRRLSLLIRDIIDFEKIKRNEIELNLTAIDIRSASTVVVEVLKHLIDSKNVEILVSIPEDLSPVFADENRLLQVLFNLLGNGVKFTAKGTVTLSAEEKGDFVKISIEDTGIGISKEKQGKLFYAFSQAEEETSIQYGGSGLGLYISRQLLKRMNGQIFLEWSEPQKGTCFSFVLPKTKVEPANKKRILELESEEAAATIKVENKSVKNCSILAVDDKITNLRALKSIFHDREYEVLTASNGMEAIEIVNTEKDIDLVLMDVMMPGISGYEACRKIREKYSSYDLPVVILTVRDAPEDIAAGFDAGANDFVTKPFVAKELRARVSNLIQMKKSVQKALKNEMAFLQSQIKPHFLYNAISTIMSFCYTDGARAGELLAYLSQYLQKSFNIDNTATTVSLENELELTKAYTEIQKARFGERLTVEYDIDDSLMEQRILPLIIQPLVENSIQHGLMKRKNGGIVKITVKKEIGGIRISVEDNGIGI
ncbi:ABC transporter substrate binding protein [Clostridium magnum]|uniref:Stage 0 sporulation protein A homolog n=1 Tax=Clostridium magnum DSM 2767 TaxID=1121326 RepID=A0A162RZC8_9CLOT|nr:ABC transporter substrate binding protein [Clostridium magnum]KZL90583.1 sensory/regulatory protein RpfC [Clostridium magnum DSM 2767]SHI05429.1 Signal transduction histidine kinase [Clostridium magnum DSM 2767]